MDLRQLQIFVSLSKTLNFSETARNSFITQPAVSHHIKSLEMELGTALLYRKGHKVILTEEGEVFLEHALDILKTEARAKTIIKNMTDGMKGVIKVAAIPTLNEELCCCLAELSKNHPKIQVIIDQMEGDEFMRCISADEYDFYFGANRMFSNLVGYNQVITKKTRLKLFVHNEVVEKNDVTDWEALKDLPFVSISPTDTVLTEQVLEICTKRGFTPNIINYYNRAELVPLAVNAGIGIDILPAPLEEGNPFLNVRTFDINDEGAELFHIIAWRKLRNSASVEFQKVIDKLYMKQNN